MMKNTALVHWSSSAFSTAGVLFGQGPSSKVSTTSLSERKSNCLKCSKPKPGPPVVSISTTRETPSASGLAQAFSATGAGASAGAGAAPGLGPIAPVTSTSSFALSLAASLAGGSVNGGACRAGTNWGIAASPRSAPTRYQPPAIALAMATTPSIRANALSMSLFPLRNNGKLDTQEGDIKDALDL